VTDGARRWPIGPSGPPYDAQMAELRLDPGEWLISINSWVIQDGNYPDFAIGERRRFALAFFETDLVRVDAAAPSARSIGDGQYRVTAKVVVAAKDFVMLDVGLLAYTSGALATANDGAWLAGRISLEVDPYDYFENHAGKRAVPAAVHTWTITGIWLQTAPFVAASAEDLKRYPAVGISGNLLVRDSKRLGWSSLERTDAWADDDGHAEYLLRCRLEEVPPVRHP
jgi:hypothetical protein